MTKDKKLDTKITTTVFGKKQEITYREYCAISGIPEEIMLWRIEKGVCQSRLLVKPTHILFYDGQYCTAGMLSERFKVSESALVNRWTKGKRGQSLVAKEDVNNQTHNPDLERKRAIKDSRSHLLALCRAHPERIENAIKYAVDGHLDPFDEAQARHNAKRFEAMAGMEVRQTGVAA
jgi:hypothetical protein